MRGILNRKYFLLTLFFIVLASYPIFRKTFEMGLYGDDWIFLAFATKPQYQVFPKLINTYFIGAYASSGFYMKVIYELFGYQSGAPYYVISYIFRLIASLGFYIFGTKVFKNRFIGFIMALAFVVTPLGLETTDWVFNAFSYISIFLINIFLLLFYKSLSKVTTKEYIMMLSIFIFSMIFMPHRANGLIPITLGVSLIFAFLYTNLVIRKRLKIVFSLIILMAISLFMWKFNVFGASSDNSLRLSQARSQVEESINNSNYTFLYNPMLTLSNIYLPSGVVDYRVLEDNFMNILPKQRAFTFFYLALFFSYFFINILLAELFYIKPDNKKVRSILISFALFVASTTILYLLHKTNFTNISEFSISLHASVGIYLSAFLLSIFITNRENKKIFFLTSVILISSVSFVLIPSLYNPLSYFDSTHRYMVTSSIPQIYFIGLLVYLSAKGIRKFNRRQFFRFSIFLSVLVFSFIYIYQSYRVSDKYINLKLSKHPQDAVDQFWDTFILQNKDVDKVYLFLPKDEIAKNILYSTVDYSSTGRIMIEYDYDYTYLVPTKFLFDKDSFLQYVENNNITREDMVIYEIYGYTPIEVTDNYLSDKMI